MALRGDILDTARVSKAYLYLFSSFRGSNATSDRCLTRRAALHETWRRANGEGKSRANPESTNFSPVLTTRETLRDGNRKKTVFTVSPYRFSRRVTMRYKFSVHSRLTRGNNDESSSAREFRPPFDVCRPIYFTQINPNSHIQTWRRRRPRVRGPGTLNFLNAPHVYYLVFR